MNLVEVVVALVGIIGALSGALGVLVRALIVAKDQEIKRLSRELAYWQRLAGARNGKRPLDRRRHGDDADADDPDKEDAP